ncbi:tetratricopeptide repeat protein [Streptomyces sp. NPDC058739]|uniref:tetratricopeptide repeat protein n=1 Tax=Streptomyces sp. NPDC058739 TaxID=3346618 RepID=UPI00369283E2
MGKGKIEYAAPRPAAAWPHQVGTLPPQAAYFQHRAEIAELSVLLSQDGAEVLDGGATAPQVCAPTESGAVGVVTGLGGVGKSQLAARYARGALQDGELDVLVWVTAATRTAIVDTYAQAAAELMGQAAPEDPERAAAAFLAWLAPKAGQRRCRWLVVLDDLDDPEVMKGLWPQHAPTGRTLVTTRRQDPALLADRCLIRVGVFAPTESRAYLAGVLRPYGLAEPGRDLDALADTLGHLPLALAQAAICIAEQADSGMTPAGYRRRFLDRTMSLRDAAPDRLPDGQSVTVAGTWSMSIELADRLRPEGLAGPMLQLAAFLDPNGVPHTVLSGDRARTLLGRQPGRASWTVTEEEALAALGTLARLNLIQYTPNAPATAVRVHQLVQRAVRDQLDPARHRLLARTAADALLTAWPRDERDSVLAQSLRANATVVAVIAGSALYRAEVHGMLGRAGSSLGESGQFSAAAGHFHQVARTADGQLGPRHPDTLRARLQYAHWRGKSGDEAGAAAVIADLLYRHLKQALGPDHHDTLAARHELANWTGQAGNAAGAVAALTELLSDRLRVLDERHPQTIDTQADLANWRGEAGNAVEAAAELGQLVPVCEQVLGTDCLRTLGTRASLARWQGMAGNPAAAVAELERLYRDRLRVQGPLHPDTLDNRAQLAVWRGEAGDMPGAVEALDRLHRDCIRVLGPEHPQTLDAGADLARWRGRAGDKAGAAAQLERLLQVYERVLGPAHVRTLTTRGDLAHWQGERGNTARAVTDLRRLWLDRLRVQGRDHPATLTARHHLAYWRARAADLPGAVREYADVLADRRRVLGRFHPDTLATRYNLAHWQAQAEDFTAAAETVAELLRELAQGPRPQRYSVMEVAAFAALLRDQLRVRGEEPVAAVLLRYRLVHWQAEAGDIEGALDAVREVLPDMTRVLGLDHAETLVVRHNEAQWQGQSGDARGAAAAIAEMLPDLRRVLGEEHEHVLVARYNVAHWWAEDGDSGRALAAIAEVLPVMDRVLGPGHAHTIAARRRLEGWS